MLTFLTPASLQEGAAALFGASAHTGFCAHCERVSRWEDLTVQYRCTQCGHDPVVGADEAVATGPVLMTEAFAPTVSAPRAPRRRWTDRLPVLWPSEVSRGARRGRAATPFLSGAH